MSKRKEKKQIKVDKDFFEKLLKAYTDLKNRVDLLENNRLPVKEIKEEEGEKKIEEKGAFWCGELCFHQVKTPEDLIENEYKIKEFRQKLKQLMKEYKIAQVSASILQKQ